jgi:hypothetical protein
MGAEQDRLDPLPTNPTGLGLRWQILQSYRAEGMTSPELDEIERKIKAEIFRSLTPEQWLEGLTCEKRLEGLTFKERLKKLGFPVEAIEEALQKQLQEADSSAKPG